MKKYTAIILIIGLVASLLCGCNADFVAYDNSDKYISGSAELSEEISAIDVSWSSGKVNLSYYDGDNVKFEEKSKEELNDENKLRYLVEMGTLKIKYKKSGISGIFDSTDKELYIYMPNGFNPSKIDISVSSADVDIDSVSAGEIDVESSSGDINAKIENANEADFSTASGKVVLTGNTVNSIDIETTSGKVDFCLNSDSKEIGIETSSGDVQMKLPENLGFKLEKESASGKFESDFPFVMSGEYYVHDVPTAEIEIETASGDISVMKNSLK